MCFQLLVALHCFLFVHSVNWFSLFFQVPQAIKDQYALPPPLLPKPKQIPDVRLLAGTKEQLALTQAEQEQVILNFVP